MVFVLTGCIQRLAHTEKLGVDDHDPCTTEFVVTQKLFQKPPKVSRQRGLEERRDLEEERRGRKTREEGRVMRRGRDGDGSETRVQEKIREESRMELSGSAI